MPLPVLIEEAALLGLHVTPAQAAAFEAYSAELITWNHRINLTAIIEPREIESKHFLDSVSVVAALPGLPPIAGARIIDVGSGAGFPGIPLKILFPETRLTLLEATGKKADFLRHMVEVLRLRDVTVVAERAETLGHAPQQREQYDLVLARAVANLAALAELTLPFARVGGAVVLHKKGEVAAEVAAAAKAVRMLGGATPRTVAVRIPSLGGDRILVRIEKSQPTPPGYPRRPGLPTKRPLG